ncbi:restriction endonuclease subunit S [Hoyosella sp. YIM 151337]|uniref:restriction endonuclease subunit S n=1 Tax=Hoyosella sp. YIM 151337 TaxID=2992742 RepID=UPI0022354AEC|nr:restriction endonuclease subunit S [Hoyosella sp. YIM 151337]MCW4355957.1 restriction endonuclease subunit S [Hoyosella sp. YIM 151337]
MARAGTDEYPLLSMTMRDGLVDQSAKFKKRVASNDVSDYKVVRRGQLVVGFPIDEGVLDFQSLYDAGIVSPAYGIWDLCDDTRVDVEYLKKYLRSARAMAYYKAKLRGSTARRRSLPAEIFLALPVPLPPLDEQRRITAILDHAAALRAKRRQVLAHLDDLTQAIFHDMFGDPATWASRWPMGVIGDMTQSAQYGTSAKAGDSGEWPILRMGNVTDSGRLDLRDLKYIDLSVADVPKYTVRRGDMLFNRTNSKEKVGKTAVVRTDRSLALAGYLVRVRCKPEHQSEFVSAYLTSPFGQAIRRRLAKAAVNQANINASELQRIPIALPSSDLQRKFTARIESVDAQRTAVQNLLISDDQLFASLQSRAFRGEL